jgi:hypothetical protein
MRAQGGGVIVNLVCVDDNSGAASAGKMGLLALTRAAATEFGAHNIRVNAVSSGLPEAEQLVGFPENPVELVLFLCGGESSDVYGKIIHFDPRGNRKTMKN